MQGDKKRKKDKDHVPKDHRLHRLLGIPEATGEKSRNKFTAGEGRGAGKENKEML